MENIWFIQLQQLGSCIPDHTDLWVPAVILGGSPLASTMDR